MPTCLLRWLPVILCILAVVVVVLFLVTSSCDLDPLPLLAARLREYQDLAEGDLVRWKGYASAGTLATVQQECKDLGEHAPDRASQELYRSLAAQEDLLAAMQERYATLMATANGFVAYLAAAIQTQASFDAEEIHGEFTRLEQAFRAFHGPRELRVTGVGPIQTMMLDTPNFFKEVIEAAKDLREQQRLEEADCRQRALALLSDATWRTWADIPWALPSWPSTQLMTPCSRIRRTPRSRTRSRHTERLSLSATPPGEHLGLLASRNHR